MPTHAMTMTPEQFEQRARACSTRQELEQLKENAISKGRRDFAQIAHDLLDQLFPVRTRRSGGATPSTANFNGVRQSFSTGKDAYIWLVNQFGHYQKNLFADYETFHRKRKSSCCRLAQSPTGLFPTGSNRTEVASNYVALHSGWYVDANLNHDAKFALLIQLGYLSKLNYPSDWTFEIEGGTEDLVTRQKMVIKGEELLQELLAM